MPLNMSPYPAVEETLHGVRVSDPYRWLEDRSSPETGQWLSEQGERYESYYEGMIGLDGLRTRVRNMLDAETLDQPVRIGDDYFYRHRKKGEERACIYQHDKVNRVPRLLVDPLAWGQFASVEIVRVSDDATLLAFGVRHGGTDAVEIYVVDVKAGNTLPGGLPKGLARGIAFSSDGFYYCQEVDDREADHVIRSHSFSPLTTDRTIFARPRSPGSRLVLIADPVNLGAVWIHEHGSNTVCDLYIAPRQQNGAWQTVFSNKELPYGPFLSGGRIFVLSYEATPMGKIIELSLDGRELRTTVPECNVKPRQIVATGGRLFVSYLEGEHFSIRSWTLAGEAALLINLPKDGTIQLLPQGHFCNGSLFYTHESYSQPPRIYEFHVRSNTTSLFSAEISSRSQVSVQLCEINCHSKDGTNIPITLATHKELRRGGPRPLIMTSYGGFGASMTPQFSALVTILLELGAVLAVPHIRGGGKFGPAWHEAGRMRNRQTAIDDFIAAAESLCTSGTTTSAELAIFGGSNSGLLVAAAMTQRPDLFRAVLCAAPLLDMVRYERFDRAAMWKSEYGSVENAGDFHALYSYSPYHNVRTNLGYPAVLFVSGDQDDRCNPAHVRKMAARLQNRSAQVRPILVDYSAQRGHTPALPLGIRIESLARRIAFLCRELGIEIPTEATNNATGA
jgi:prolyl oligopeptidase